MPSTEQGAMDDCVYIFHLPPLGLPDPAGEWISVKSAIASSMLRSTSLLQDANVQAPMRFPTGEYTIVEAEFQGAIWRLPCLEPRKDSEVFIVRVQRLPLDTDVKADRLKLSNNEHTVCIQLCFDDSQPVKETSCEAAKGPLAEQSKHSLSKVDSPCTQESVDSALRHEAAEPTMVQESQKKDVGKQHKEQDVGEEADEGETEEWKESMMDLLRSGEIFVREWVEEVLYAYMMRAVISGVDHKEVKAPHFRIKYQPAPNDEYRGLLYALDGGDDDGAQPLDWKVLPAHATKPGFQRCFVNAGREQAGHRPFTKAEWPPGPPSSSTSRS